MADDVCKILSFSLETFKQGSHSHADSCASKCETCLGWLAKEIRDDDDDFRDKRNGAMHLGKCQCSKCGKFCCKAGKFLGRLSCPQCFDGVSNQHRGTGNSWLLEMMWSRGFLELVIYPGYLDEQWHFHARLIWWCIWAGFPEQASSYGRWLAPDEVWHYVLVWRRIRNIGTEFSNADELVADLYTGKFITTSAHVKVYEN